MGSTRGGFEGESSLVTEKEKKRILDRYMTELGTLKSYPHFDKNRRVILEAVLNRFSIGKPYSEEEIKEILTGIYSDYKLLRNELMAYDYLNRTHTGAIYWVKNYEAV